MRARHLEFLVEEPSMEAFLQALLPRLLPDDCTLAIHPYRGKHGLLRNLNGRLSGYKNWLPPDWRLFVMVDRDGDDCRELKASLEDAAVQSGLRTRSQADVCWQVVNRIVIEELEAWYFGDWEAMRKAYSRVPQSIPNRARYRDPDAVPGGTWEAFERILQRHGYFETGLRKIEAARAIAAHIDPQRNRSHSFAAFREVLAEAVSQETRRTAAGKTAQPLRHAVRNSPARRRRPRGCSASASIARRRVASRAAAGGKRRRPPLAPGKPSGNTARPTGIRRSPAKRAFCAAGRRFWGRRPRCPRCPARARMRSCADTCSGRRTIPPGRRDYRRRSGYRRT